MSRQDLFSGLLPSVMKVIHNHNLHHHWFQLFSLQNLVLITFMMLLKLLISSEKILSVKNLNLVTHEPCFFAMYHVS